MKKTQSIVVDTSNNVPACIWNWATSQNPAVGLAILASFQSGQPLTLDPPSRGERRRQAAQMLIKLKRTVFAGKSDRRIAAEVVSRASRPIHGEFLPEPERTIKKIDAMYDGVFPSESTVRELIRT